MQDKYKVIKITKRSKEASPDSFDSRASDTFRATAYRGVSGCVRSGAWSVGLAALAVSAWPPKFKIRKNTLSL